MKIVVFGSINIDLVSRVERLPAPGETLRARNFLTVPGGKGANQAAACARLGAATFMVGRVGDDVFGPGLRDGLSAIGVDTQNVMFSGGPSGIAVIAVDAAGQNNIIIVPGANGRVAAADLDRLNRILPGADFLLLQLEIPLEAVVAAARLARDLGVRVMLDPAPVCPLPAWLYPLVDLLTPNETECAALIGFPLKDSGQVERAAGILLERGARQVAIKLGERGVFFHDGQRGELLPGFPVKVVDTTAAGDAFNGALAVGLGQGWTLRETARFANAAGALAVTKPGAQPSMPTLDEVQQFLENR